MISDISTQDESDDEILMVEIAATAAALATASIVAHVAPLVEKTPYHTSALSGLDWVRELLHGHPEHIRCELGVHKHVFVALIKYLQQAGVSSSKHMLLEEKLAMFLYTCVTGLSIHHVCEQFQRATETTSR